MNDQAQRRALAPYETAIASSKKRFVEIAGEDVWNREQVFAIQALIKNDYAMQVANKNPFSVQLAVVNVASTGLTLNPANGYAYLVPRDGAVVLDISYKGLIKIATDAGSILWARVDLVYEADEFIYHGPARQPEHRTNPFSKNRGAVVGVYCIAKTNQGDILTDVMDMAEIEKIRSKSDLYARKQSGPWVDWFEQMAKKSIVKRARNYWPYTERMAKLGEIIEQQNVAEGGYTLEANDPAVIESGKPTPDQRAAKRKEQHDEALARHSESVAYIKDRIAADDLKPAADEWAAIPQVDQMALWLATTKGGVFSTNERKTIKEKFGQFNAPGANHEEPKA